MNHILIDTFTAPLSIEVGLDETDDCIIVTSYSSFKHRAIQCRTRRCLHFGLARFSRLPRPVYHCSGPRNYYTHTHVTFSNQAHG